MAWTPVPWFVGGGAEHSADVARQMTYATLGGREGIVNSTDFRVTAMPAPDGRVRVGPGAVAITSRAPGHPYETYTGAMPTEEILSIAPTGGAGGRSDLIVARVEDPHVGGPSWAAPSDVTAGPYIHLRVIPNVGTAHNIEHAGIGDHSAIPIARVDIPANTTAITQAMIVDLRQMAHARTERALLSSAIEGQFATGQLGPPDWSIVSPWNPWVTVPPWASQVHIVGRVASLAHYHSPILLEQCFRGVLGNALPSGPNVIGPQAYYPCGDQGHNHDYWFDASFSVAGRIPDEMRGTGQQLYVQAWTHNGVIIFHAGTNIQWDVTFYEAPE